MTCATSATSAAPPRRGRGRPAGATTHPRHHRRRADVYAQRLRVQSDWLIQLRRRLRNGRVPWTAALEREAVVAAVGTAQLVDQVRALRPDAKGTSS